MRRCMGGAMQPGSGCGEGGGWIRGADGAGWRSRWRAGWGEGCGMGWGFGVGSGEGGGEEKGATKSSLGSSAASKWGGVARRAAVGLKGRRSGWTMGGDSTKGRKVGGGSGGGRTGMGASRAPMP